MSAVPSSLEQTTLGDVLGQLLRADATGALYLIETSSHRAGRTHRIHLRTGRPVVVASDGDRLGQLLMARGAVDEPALARALGVQRAGDKRLLGELLIDLGPSLRPAVESNVYLQTRARLESLFGLPDARVSFYSSSFELGFEGAFGRAARCGQPLSPHDYLHGKPRRRGRGSCPPRNLHDLRDHELLGVEVEPTEAELRKAFRRLAFELHPDRASTPNERQAREAQLAKVSAAYHRLASGAKT